MAGEEHGDGPKRRNRSWRREWCDLGWLGEAVCFTGKSKRFVYQRLELVY